MSSLYVRTQIKQFLTDNSNEDFIDLTSQFEEVSQLIAEAGLQPDASWLGLRFIGDDVLPVSLAATNDKGLYRETGAIFLDVVSEAKIGVGDSLLNRGETLQNLFTGRTIGDITITSVSTMNTEAGATLEFEAGYMSGTIRLGYYRDKNL